MKRIIYTVSCLLFFASLASAQVVVIANNGISESSITNDELTKIFALNKTKWSRGESVVVIGHKTEDASVKAFYGYLGKTKKKHRKIWMKKILQGDAQAPEEFPTEDAVVQKVASTPGAISFVDKSKITGDVKILLELK